MNEPRKHHFIPQCYLRNFSIANNRKQVHLLDARRKIQCVSSIADIAQRRDFNRVEIDGIDPNAIEKGFSQLEGQANLSIESIIAGADFVSNVKDNILNLIALLAVRGPQKRSNFAQSYAHTAKIILDLSLATRERWDAYMEKFPADQRVCFEEAKEFYTKEKYSIETPRETHIRDELKMFDVVLPLIHARKWQLITSVLPTHVFFSSDNPVAIRWNEPDAVPLIHRSSPGFGMADTTVFFPLTSSHFLLGRFDIDADGYVDATDELVASCNTQTLLNTHEQIYASSLDAYIKTDNGMLAIKNLLSNLMSHNV